ncbi:MAG: hypothetical protein WCS72_03510 [Deltaproteobacteria bacterium]
MATKKAKVPAKRGSRARPSTTEQELEKFGRAVAKAANALQKSGPSSVRMLRLPSCLSHGIPWCLPIKDRKGKSVWIAIKVGKIPRS